MTENCLEISYSKTFHLRRVPYNLRIWMTYLQVIRQRSLFNDYKWLMHTCMFFWLKNQKKIIDHFSNRDWIQKTVYKDGSRESFKIPLSNWNVSLYQFLLHSLSTTIILQRAKSFCLGKDKFFFFHVLVILVVSHNSIRGCIHQSVGPSAGLSIGPFITFSLFY